MLKSEKVHVEIDPTTSRGIAITEIAEKNWSETLENH